MKTSMIPKHTNMKVLSIAIDTSDVSVANVWTVLETLAFVTPVAGILMFTQWSLGKLSKWSWDAT